MTKQKSGTETVAYKESTLNGLVTTLELLSRPMTLVEKSKHDVIKRDMNDALDALWQESRGRELDIKITSFKKLISMLKRES